MGLFKFPGPLLFNRQNRIEKTIQIQIDTLENMWDILQLNDEQTYLKLDTQGYDLECLKGTGEHLDKVCALQTEASVVQIYDGMPSYAEVIRFCETNGFSLSGIYPNNPSHFPALMEFDAHFIRRKHVPNLVINHA